MIKEMPIVFSVYARFVVLAQLPAQALIMMNHFHLVHPASRLILLKELAVTASLPIRGHSLSVSGWFGHDRESERR